VTSALILLPFLSVAPHKSGTRNQEALDGQHSTAGHYVLSSYEKFIEVSNSEAKN
jgi:hypothetical protein